MHLHNLKNLAFVFSSVVLILGVAAFADNPLPVEPAALDFANIRALSKAEPNLAGEGVLIGTICRSQSYVSDRPQNDYHFNMNHNSLFDGDVRFMDGTDGRFSISEHATCIGGILLGLDETADHPDLGAFEYRGVCPDASVNAYEFEQFSIRYLLGKKVVDEDVIVLSLGVMFEDWWVRALEQAAEEKDFLVVASIGNGGSSFTPDPLFPAAGSNVLSVGVVDAVTDANNMTRLRDFSTPKSTNSSTGPTEDRRCKPDMVAPGTALVPAAYSEDGYELKHNWSSLAAPVVAGTAALLQQKAMTDDALMNDFSLPGKGLVLKAVLMNSAKKLPYWHKGAITSKDDHRRPLDYTQGAGMLDALAAYAQLIAGRSQTGSVHAVGWDNRMIANRSKTGSDYTFDVSDPNQMITATLCWNRAYEPEYPFNHALEKDADLRLELWAVNPENPNELILVDFSDSVNDNVEHLYVACDPAYTTYTLRIKFNKQQPDEPSIDQRYAVAWSVGPDRQADNPWWNDLNEDNTIDASDRILYTLIESGMIDNTEIHPIAEAMGLSKERLQLLVTGWPLWKPYITIPMNTAE